MQITQDLRVGSHKHMRVCSAETGRLLGCSVQSNLTGPCISEGQSFMTLASGPTLRLADSDRAELLYSCRGECVSFGEYLCTGLCRSTVASTSNRKITEINVSPTLPASLLCNWKSSSSMAFAVPSGPWSVSPGWHVCKLHLRANGMCQSVLQSLRVCDASD